MQASNDTYLGAATMLGALSSGLGLMLLTTRGSARSSLGIGGLFLFVGPAYVIGTHVAGTVGPGPALLARAEGLCEIAAMLSGVVYLGGLGETSHAGPTALRRFRVLVRGLYALAAVLLVCGLLAPRSRMNDFLFQGGDSSSYGEPRFWLFASGWLVAGVLFVGGYLFVARIGLDRGERARALFAAVAAALLIAGLVAPRLYALVLCGAALLAAMFGQFRYAIIQGERGVFLSRFLSPHVAEQVRTDGLSSVMQPAEVVLTVVACDLRGFTSYAEAVPSQAVIDLLGEYYEVVGRAVGEVDGTIKDYAGDGILVLLGAPIPHPDHAAAGLELARRIHEVTRPVIDRWTTDPHPLGIGVGVATGRVTVGAIGSDARMEYTAVGTPVNLAARLCSAAASGETLIDGRTAGAASRDQLVPRQGLALKGLAHQSEVYVLPAATPTDPAPSTGPKGTA